MYLWSVHVVFWQSYAQIMWSSNPHPQDQKVAAQCSPDVWLPHHISLSSATYRILALVVPFNQSHPSGWRSRLKAKIGSYFTQHLLSLSSTPTSPSCRFWTLVSHSFHLLANAVPRYLQSRTLCVQQHTPHPSGNNIHRAHHDPRRRGSD